MSFLKDLFKKEETQTDILEIQRREILKKSWEQLKAMRIDAKKEAQKIAVCCRMQERQNNLSDYVGPALLLMSYPEEIAAIILDELVMLCKEKNPEIEPRILEALGRIDELYEGDASYRDLQRERTEVFYLFGKKSSYREKKAAGMLAIRIMTRNNTEEARNLYKQDAYGEGIRELIDQIILTYGENILNELKK